jgi:hypothetical protein
MLQVVQGAGTESGGKQAGQAFNIDDISKAYSDALESNTTGFVSSIKESINVLETQANSMAKIFGGTTGFAKAIKQSINDAIPSVIELGGTIDDVQKMQIGTVKQLQTQTMLNAETYKDLFASAALVSDGTTGTAEMATGLVRKFADAGYGLNNIGKEMTGILNTAREIGVTSVAVYKQIGDSINRLNLYNFEGGIQGMAKMAANAALLRIDMKNTLGLADQLFDPQKAVEMSAGFQRLGVQVSSLLDPYKLMDMARNDPAKLQEEMGRALQSMTYFDEKTKSMRILPGAQGQLREIQQLTGIGLEQLSQWATSSGDISRKMKEIRFSSDFASEEDRKMIAGMAQLGKTGGKFEGEYVVTLPSGEEKAVATLSDKDRDALKEINKPAASAVDLQKEANGILNGILNGIKALKGAPARGIVGSEDFQNTMNKLAKNVLTAQEAFNNTVGLKRELTQGDKTGFVSPAQLNKTMAGFTAEIKTMITDVLSGDMTKLASDALNAGGKVKTTFGGMASNFPTELGKAEKLYGTNTTEDVNLIISALNDKLSGLGISIPTITPGQTQATPQQVTPVQTTTPASSIIGTTPTSTINSAPIAPPNTESKVTFDGTININVTPNEFSQSLKTAFADAGIAKSIFASYNKTSSVNQDLKGTGESKNKVIPQMIA